MQTLISSQRYLPPKMTGRSQRPRAWRLSATIVLLLLLCLPGSASALPGDLSCTLELQEQELEATPDEASSTVTFHGNVTFEQPVWQYSSAALSVEVDKNWTASASPASLTNRGPGTRSFTVSVEVPPSALGGEVVKLDVVAECSNRFGGNQVVTDLATVRVRPWYGYRVNTTEAVQLVIPQGASGVLSVPVRNVGNAMDTFSGTVPYWYGLRPLGVVVTAPTATVLRAKESADLEFAVSVSNAATPRTYAFDLLLDSSSLLRGGEGATEDPRTVRAEVYVTGNPAPEDPYETWGPGDPPEALSQWTSVFGSSEERNNPDIDPAGEHLVYDQRIGGERVIYLGEASGSGARRLTNGHVDHHPILSPNGRSIAFARAPDRILVVNHNGTELLEFGTELGWVNLTDWSPSGDRLLLDAGGDIFELDLQHNATRWLTGEPVDQWGAVYSPDGSRVYYLSYEAAGVAPEIWYMTSDGAAHTQMTFNELAERSVSVSPNGKRVAFTLREAQGGGDRVCVMDPDGSDVRYFTDRSRDVFVLRWLPGGSRLYAEVSSYDSTSHDIEQVAYPWKDAGASDGGGSGAPGGGGDTEPIWASQMFVYSVATIVLVVVLAAGGTGYRRRRRRQREEAADELRKQLEAEHRARAEISSRPVEVFAATPSRAPYTGGHGYDPYSR